MTLQATCDYCGAEADSSAEIEAWSRVTVGPLIVGAEGSDGAIWERDLCPDCTKALVTAHRMPTGVAS